MGDKTLGETIGYPGTKKPKPDDEDEKESGVLAAIKRRLFGSATPKKPGQV